MPSSSKRSFDKISDHARRESKMVVDEHVGESNGCSFMLDLCICHSQFKKVAQELVGYHAAESSNEPIMLQSRERPLEDTSDQIRKKCKMGVDSHLGKSSGRLSMLDFHVCGSTSQKLLQSVGVNCRRYESCESPTISSCVKGLVELIHFYQEMLKRIRKIAPETDVQMSSRKEREFAVDWSALEVDILVRIAENHLLSPDDFAMFSSVCRSWHCAAVACNLVKLNKKWTHKQMPWVMLTDGELILAAEEYRESVFTLPQVLNDIEEFDIDTNFKSDCVMNNTRCVLSLKLNKYVKVICPELHGRACWGSAHGWIVTAGGDGKMFIFNPFTKSRVGLPSFGTFRWRWDNEDEVRRNRFVTKAVVLNVGGDDGDQNSGDGIEDLRVVVFYGKDHVAMVKPGNKRWIEIEGEARTYSPLMDVTYDSKLGLIFVDNSGGLCCCSLPEKEESPFLKWFKPPRMDRHLMNHSGPGCSMSYIVKCGADLLMVTRFLRFEDDIDSIPVLASAGIFFVDYYMTTKFWLNKYDCDKNLWVEVSELKDVALFVGNNTTMWAHEPGSGCIYFNDDQRNLYHKTRYMLGGHDSGVFKFNLDESFCTADSFERNLYGGTDYRSGYCCPFFFKPSICVSEGQN